MLIRSENEELIWRAKHWHKSLTLRGSPSDRLLGRSDEDDYGNQRRKASASFLRKIFGRYLAPHKRTVPNDLVLLLEVQWNALAELMRSIITLNTHCLSLWLVVTFSRGRTLTERIEAADYDHLIAACLLHDIGYVRGILKGDTKTHFVIDESGRTVTLPRGASDAALTPYHVNRSKIFVHERLGKSPTLDADRLARAIEATRFPPGHIDDDLEPTLVQAADLIGQLGDPLYARKANALYYEFEEIGMNWQLGYTSPADLIDKYPSFFWKTVFGHLGASHGLP